MEGLLRIPIEGGGSIVVEARPTAAIGPVKVGRGADLVQEASVSLQSALGPVKEAARVVLEQLKDVGPDEVEVEFGIEFSAEAGAVIAKASSGCHFTVTLTWKNQAP